MNQNALKLVSHLANVTQDMMPNTSSRAMKAISAAMTTTSKYKTYVCQMSKYSATKNTGTIQSRETTTEVTRSVRLPRLPLTENNTEKTTPD